MVDRVFTESGILNNIIMGVFNFYFLNQGFSMNVVAGFQDNLLFL